MVFFRVTVYSDAWWLGGGGGEKRKKKKGAWGGVERWGGQNCPEGIGRERGVWGGGGGGGGGRGGGGGGRAGGGRKTGVKKKRAPGAAWSDECVKTAQRKLAGRDGGAGMAGQNIRGDSVMNGFSGK